MSGDRAPRLEKTAELTLPITTHANETRNAYREVDAVRLVESLLVAFTPRPSLWQLDGLDM